MVQMLHVVDVIRTGSRLVRDAGGNRTHFNCFAGSRLAIWLQRQVDRPQVTGGHLCFYSLKVVVAIDAIKSAPTSSSIS